MPTIFKNACKEKWRFKRYVLRMYPRKKLKKGEEKIGGRFKTVGEMFASFEADWRKADLKRARRKLKRWAARRAHDATQAAIVTS